jgi:hypothetical protein
MAAAKRFTKQDYQPCSDQGPSKDLKGKLNAQFAFDLLEHDGDDLRVEPWPRRPRPKK